MEEMTALRKFVESLPTPLSNRLLAAVIHLSALEITGPSANDGGGISVLALARLFLHDATTKLSLASLPASALLLNKIPDCTSLVSLDLSTHSALSDSSLAKVLGHLKLLEQVVLRGCTKVGDLSVIALSKSAKEHLREVNLSMTAVTIRGLTALLACCPMLEVLKLANVQALVRLLFTHLLFLQSNVAFILNIKDREERHEMDGRFNLYGSSILRVVFDAYWSDYNEQAGSELRHHLPPLLHLRTLKFRSTELTESSLGRILNLCSFTLTHLDISYTQVRSLDLLSRLLHTAPTWNLRKLVASGLPLSPVTLVGFFQPLSERPLEERTKFETLKLGSIPSASTKSPGLTDRVLAQLLPFWEQLEGLENISLFQNWELGKDKITVNRFMSVCGKRCKTLDLTSHITTSHLQGLLPRYEWDVWEIYDFPVNDDPPRLEILILDSTKIDDGASVALSYCKQLKALHLAETKISSMSFPSFPFSIFFTDSVFEAQFLADVLLACPKLETLNLTSCRGVPVAQRRSFFDAWGRGEVEIKS